MNNDICVSLETPTEQGHLLYVRDPDVAEHLLYLRSPEFQRTTYSVTLEDPVIFRLDSEGILGSAKFVIPRRAWIQTATMPVPTAARSARLRFTPATIEQRSVDMTANVMTNKQYSYAAITFGSPEVHTFWVALSQNCFALLAGNRLKGFFILIER